jgi:hypothetical protein
MNEWQTQNQGISPEKGLVTSENSFFGSLKELFHLYQPLNTVEGDNNLQTEDFEGRYCSLY